MRKLILVSAFALAAISVQAGNPVLAADDLPAAAATPAISDAAGSQAPRKQASRAKRPQRESDEAKARRIAAKYGVSW